MTKRLKSSNTTERIDHQIAEAVQADRQFLLEHAAVLSVKDTRKRLAGMLGVDPEQLKTPGAKAALDSALHSIVSTYWDTEMAKAKESNRPSLDMDRPFDRLPMHVLPTIFRHLDCDGLGFAPQVCRAWRMAMLADEIWTHRVASLPSAFHPEWPAEKRYQEYRGQCCFDCSVSTDRLTLGFGSMRLRLCEDCQRGYADRRPQQRLLSKGSAMHLYKLRAEDMQPPEVPHALDANPINPQWHLMELYRRPDVVRAAIRKYGGVEQMWAHRQPSAVSC